MSCALGSSCAESRLGNAKSWPGSAVSLFRRSITGTTVVYIVAVTVVDVVELTVMVDITGLRD